MSDAVLVALIGAASGGLPVILGFIGKYYFDKTKEKKAQSFNNVIPKMHNVYHHLNNIVAHYGSKRAMVMYVENGGGRPSIGSKLFVSIAYEVFTKASQSIREAFQRVQIDDSYITMLGYMMSNHGNRTISVTSQMPDCLLRNVYLEAGTAMSIVYLVKITDTKLYYASFNFPHEELSDNLLYHCDLEAAAIRNLFKDLK